MRHLRKFAYAFGTILCYLSAVLLVVGVCVLPLPALAVLCVTTVGGFVVMKLTEGE